MRSAFVLWSLLTIFSLAPWFTAHAAGPATAIDLVPSSATVSADQVVTFTVHARYADGTTADVTSQSTLSANDPRGKVSGATYAAGKVGTWQVQGSYQSLVAQAIVTVTPGALHELELNPNSQPETVVVGKKRTFAVRGFDQNSNETPIDTIDWTITDPIGTINDQGVFTATKVGAGSVQAKSNEVTARVPIKVVAISEAVTTNTNTTPSTTTSNTNTANQNTNVNGNTNQPANVNEAPTSTDNQTTKPCTTARLWVWVIILIAFLAGVALLYAFVPVARIWPAVLAFIIAIILTMVQRRYGCDLYQWWAWIITLGTVALTIMGMRQNTPPANTPPTTNA